MRQSEVNLSIGRQMLAAGRLSEGVASLAAALESQPDLLDARIELANALVALRRLDEAVRHYEIAVAAQPSQLALRTSLAALLSEVGRHSDAVREGGCALALEPNHVPALYNRATSLLALGEAKAAREGLARCALLTPDDPKVHNNLGLALAAEHQYEAALEAYGRALRLQPGYFRALNNRATALMSLRRFDEAVADLRAAVALQPRYTRALLNLGLAFRVQERYEDAVASYRRAFPDPEALAGATDLLMKELHRGGEALECATELYRLAPERDEVAGTYHAASQALAQWRDYESRVAAIVAGVRTGKRPVSPFRFLYVTDAPEDQLACARSAASTLPPQKPLWNGEIYPHSRIRVAYLSSDFCTHATAYLAAGLFERHDRERFECFALSYGRPTAADPMRTRLEAAFEHFEDVDSLSALQIAERVRSLEIDVLVDMKGYTGGSRFEVLSYRPAPVQVHFLGYPGTLGAPFVDYLIADHTVVPPQDAPHYAEQIVRLPHTYQVTDDRRAEDTHSWTRERAGLPSTGLVLAAFHQTYKLTPPVFDVWMRLLRNLPGSCLWVLDRNLGARSRLMEEAAARGIDPARLIFAPEVPQPEHLSRQRLADLLLDTWPYSSHTTASDALWVGLPVVALNGRSFAARVSASIVRAAGLPDLVAGSLAEYETLITRLCTEPGRLAALRRELEIKVRSSPLFDTAGFTRALESCYVQMCERYRAGLAPAPIEA